MTASLALSLAKHHGLGNDFLVAVVDDAARLGIDEHERAQLARRLCDRRTGVGADGLLLAIVGDVGEDVDVAATMVLYNADGSRAEMSGNGIRCLVHAVARRSGPVATMRVATMRIVTDAGLRVAELEPTADPATLMVTVDMGAVLAGGEPAGWGHIGIDPGRPVAHLSLGNPHTVVPVDDVDDVDLEGLGRRVPGVNLEIVQPTERRDVVRMRVHERGAGVTAACGTGACAAAVAAARWGLVTPRDGKVIVEMDGGPATVFIDTDDPHAPKVRLQGPTTFVADVAVPVTPVPAPADHRMASLSDP